MRRGLLSLSLAKTIQEVKAVFKTYKVYFIDIYVTYKFTLKINFVKLSKYRHSSLGCSLHYVITFSCYEQYIVIVRVQTNTR
jgi:hypothetical protein